MAIQHGERAKGRIVGNVVLGESAKKRTPFIECYGEITEGENKGARARWTGYFGPNSSERTVEALETCGWEGEDLSEFSDGELHGLDKNEVEFVLELEEYEKDGEKRVSPRIAFINRLGGYLNVDNAMTPEAAQSFGEKMKGLVLKVKSRKPDTAGGADFPHGANVEQPQKATGTGGRKRF